MQIYHVLTYRYIICVYSTYINYIIINNTVLKYLMYVLLYIISYIWPTAAIYNIITEDGGRARVRVRVCLIALED